MVKSSLFQAKRSSLHVSCHQPKKRLGVEVNCSADICLCVCIDLSVCINVENRKIIIINYREEWLLKVSICLSLSKEIIIKK